MQKNLQRRNRPTTLANLFSAVLNYEKQTSSWIILSILPFYVKGKNIELRIFQNFQLLLNVKDILNWFVLPYLYIVISACVTCFITFSFRI